uniref:Uncharacterized protein n=1 Tax=Lotus japonicus TaxID=34305 RepID=I3SN52_LOTJA|nr:unknown [Lotus japonicus]
MAWAIWQHRNYVIFKEGRNQDVSIFEGAQLRAWHWFTGRVKGFNCSTYEWLAQPILCIKAAVL